MRLVSPAVAGVGIWLLGGGGAAAAADPFALAPGDDRMVARGREVAERFDLASTWEVSVPVDDAYSASSRQLAAELVAALSRIGGVRWVLGPAAVLDVVVDASGAVSSGPLFGPRHGDGERGADEDLARLRVLRRTDATGWFGAGDGRMLRFLVTTDDFDRAWPRLDQIIRSAAASPSTTPGAVGAVAASPLWPDPRDLVVRWGLLLPGVVGVIFVWVVGTAARHQGGMLSRGGVVAVMAASAAGAAAPFALAPLPALQGIAWLGGLATAGTVALAAVAEGRRPRLPPGAQQTRTLPLPWLGFLAAVLIVAAAAVTISRVRLSTQQWRAAPMLFVSVRGDLDEPVVLRELGRLTDHLRVQTGVAGAWSVADLFSGVRQAGDEAGRIPDSADEVRRVLSQAHRDPAVRLGLSGDHRDALVAIRFDTAVAVDRLRFVDKLARHLDGDWRPALLRVDVRRDLPDDTRALARGVLANDARERILRICARAGRNLEPSERAAIDRATRQAALIPAIDAGKLRAEVMADAQAFLHARLPALTDGERERLARAVSALEGEADAATVEAVLRKASEPRQWSDGALLQASRALVPLLDRVRTRHLVRMSYREILAAGGLPADGELADQVRGALREALGPVVGLPVAVQTAGAFHLDAVVVGGAANDRALSRAWLPGLGTGGRLGAALVTVLLMLLGGWRGLLWLPLALAVPAAALIVPAVAASGVGLPFVAFLSGAGAAGAALATSLAGRRAW